MPLAKDLTTFTTASPVVATFNYTDIADGTGKIVFQLFTAANSTPTTSYLVSENPLGSANVGYSISGSSSADTTTDTLNFDASPFNLVRTVRGNVKVRFSHYSHISSSGSGWDCSHHLKCSLYRLSGAVETLIGEETSPTIQRTSGAGYSAANRVLEFDATETLFAVGDILRIKIISYHVFGNGFNGANGFACDPDNKDWGSNITAADNPTYFKVEIPFKIDQ